MNTRYAYNTSNNLVTYTDAKLLKTKYVYDPEGELKEITSPAGGMARLGGRKSFRTDLEPGRRR